MGAWYGTLVFIKGQMKVLAHKWWQQTQQQEEHFWDHKMYSFDKKKPEK